LYSGRSHFFDNSLADVKTLAASLKDTNPKLAHELEMDYKQGVLNEAGGLLYSANRTGPKYSKDKQIKKGSDRIAFKRNAVKDLPITDRIQIAKDNIENYVALIATINMSDDELKQQLRPHNPNQLIVDDLKDIFYESVDSTSGIHKGPGQVGSPGRNGGKPFKKREAILNAVQFLTEPPTDRLLHAHVSYPQQGHIFDTKNNPEIARDIKNMRGQQAAPNVKDGAFAKGLKNLTREENLQRGLEAEKIALLELIDERLNENISVTETANLIHLARKVGGNAGPKEKELELLKNGLETLEIVL